MSNRTSATHHGSSGMFRMTVVIGILILLTGAGVWALMGIHHSIEVTDQTGTAIQGIDTEKNNLGSTLVVHWSDSSDVAAVHLIDDDGIVVERQESLTGATGAKFTYQGAPDGWKVVLINPDGEIVASATFDVHVIQAWEDGLP